jgi:hypothetical protein
LSNSRYWDQAGIVIQIQDNPNPNAKGFDNVNGHDLVTIGTPNANGTITALPSSSDFYQMVKNAITTNQSLIDNRETATIGITTFDVSKMMVNTGNPNPVYYSDDNGTNFNGILYIYNKSATSSARRGIEIKGGSKIPTKGLTIASMNPVYLQGDFNTGGSGSTVPSNNPSNFNVDGTYLNPANPPAPQVSGYTRAPCSILADAVNLLSNSWSDALSGTVPVASPTTFNTAIISGVVPTSPVGGDGAYSGGAENFPRFLENWTTKTLTYYGSMVELYQSGQSIGEWGKANVYVPPTREWFFDTNFKIKPPPGSLMIYSYSKGKWALL